MSGNRFLEVNRRPTSSQSVNIIDSMDSGLRKQTMTRPMSDHLAPNYKSPEAQAIDKWFEDLSYYERTLEEMSNTELDNSFKDELKAIENWFRVLSDPERTACIYSLLKGTTTLQIRFFITVLQQMLAKDASLDPLSSTLLLPRQVRPSSVVSDDSNGRLYSRPNSNGRLSSEIRTHSLLRASIEQEYEPNDEKKEDPVLTTRTTSLMGDLPATVPNKSPARTHFDQENMLPNIAPRQVGRSLPRPRKVQDEEEWDAPKEKSSKPQEQVNLQILLDIPAWFRSLRLHKYTTIFENDNWRNIIKLSDQDLIERGVQALGARRKMLKHFDAVKMELNAQNIPF